jgi:Mg2+ and Co2+ transporter CorA
LVITSYYGMNVYHWPDLENPLGWLWVVAITGLSTAMLAWLLKRRGWW